MYVMDLIIPQTSLLQWNPIVTLFKGPWKKVLLAGKCNKRESVKIVLD